MYTESFKVVCDLIRRQAVTYDEAYLLMRDIVKANESYEKCLPDDFREILND